MYAQRYDINLNATALKNIYGFKKGESIKIEGVEHHVTVNDMGQIDNSYSIIVNNSATSITNKVGDAFDFRYHNVQDLWDAEIICNVLTSLRKTGIQNGLRSEMESDALEYINRVKSYRLELNDPYLENYIYSLIAKIAPVNIIDGRPGNVNLLIQDDPTLNACMFPNGTLVINTGLIAALHTEDELVAVLAHEIAHFVLDHSVQNVNKNIARKKRAEFWAAFATGMTAVAEGVTAANNRYYIPGAATIGVAVIASNIASQVVDRLGMKYNAEQELEADMLAIKVLTILGYDNNALATALSRMQTNLIVERSNMMYFASYTHPSLTERIKKAGEPQGSNRNPMFEKNISFAVTSAARLKFEDRRFRQVLPLVEQNIHNSVATSEDFLLRANCMLALYNDAESNSEVLKMVNKAKEIDSQNINIYKTEILAVLRLESTSKALSLLSDYIERLGQLRAEIKLIESDQTWDAMTSFVNSEQNWANRMQVKLKGF